MKGKYNRKQRGAKRRNRRQRRVRVARNETAFIKETISLEDLKPNQPYENIVNLTQFARATDMADNFQEYRIKKLEYRYTPLYDTFNDASGADSLPYLFSKRLTYTAPPTFTLDWLKLMGAKPRRLDDKNVNVFYVPNTNLTVAGGVPPSALVGGTKPIMAPWLQSHILDATSAYVMDTTPHYGNAFWIDQDNTQGANTIVCKLELTAYFEYRKPWDKNSSIAGSQQKIQTSAK